MTDIAALAVDELLDNYVFKSWDDKRQLDVDIFKDEDGTLMVGLIIRTPGSDESFMVCDMKWGEALKMADFIRNAVHVHA